MNVKTNAEKEWLRKLTTGKVVEKTEQKAPQRAVVHFKSVTATCEFFYANEDSLEQNLRNSLQMLGVVRTVFRNNHAELSED